MARSSDISHVWDIVEDIGVCMLTTKFADGLRARPVEARLDRDSGLIRVVTGLQSPKEHEIEAEHDVGLTFVDPSRGICLSISASATVSRDRAEVEAAWQSSDSLWWQGPADPSVCVLHVTPHVAELWDGPASRIVAAYEFVKAKLTGAPPNLGENRKTTIAIQRVYATP